jgi:hypothetical protein
VDQDHDAKNCGHRHHGDQETGHKLLAILRAG